MSIFKTNKWTYNFKTMTAYYSNISYKLRYNNKENILYLSSRNNDWYIACKNEVLYAYEIYLIESTLLKQEKTMTIFLKWIDKENRVLQLVFFIEYGFEIHCQQDNEEWDVIL